MTYITKETLHEILKHRFSMVMESFGILLVVSVGVLLAIGLEVTENERKKQEIVIVEEKTWNTKTMQT